MLPQKNNVVAFWQCEEASGNLVDQLGTHTATPVGTPDYQQTGIVGYCVNLDGSTEYFSIPDHESLSPTTSGFTVSAWINPDVIGLDGIVSKYVNPVTEWSFHLNSNGALAFTLYGTGGGYIGRSTAAGVITTVGGWYHVVGTYSGETTPASINIYANGQDVDTTDDIGGVFTAPLNSSSPVWIGATYNTDCLLDGQIDEVIIWQGKELTQGEVTTLYANGAPTRKLYSLKASGHLGLLTIPTIPTIERHR